MNLKVHNPNNLPTMDYRKWIPLQGHLKDLNKENYNKLKSVLEKRGFTVPAFLWHNKEDDKYYIMDAHQRQRVLIKENATPYELPYVLIEADNMQDAKAQLLEITSQYGTITYEGLDEFIELAELPQAEVYEAVHFDGLPLLGQEDEPEVEEDEAPEVSSEPPVSELGVVYQLGRHRVMCGDSTDADAVSELMDGKKADMVFTDPPYGIDLDTDLSSIKTELKGWKGQGGKYSKVIGDDRDYDPAHIFEMFGYVKEIFLWGGDYFAERIPAKNDGAWFVWDKTINQDKGSVTWNLGSMFELCWSKQRHKREVVRKLWAGLYGTETQDARSRIHPTQKPLEVCTWFIKKFSKEGDVVIDPFLGSGSTLIACEQTDRTCYGMELDPKYCDVIRKRYWKLINDGVEEGWEAGTPVIA